VVECVFCRIVAGEVPATILFRDDSVVGFLDRDGARSPFHALVVPTAHVAKLSDLGDVELGGRLLQVVRKVAADAGYAEQFRVVVNNGESAGQEIWHLHLHVLAGRAFGWPPG
jgi:histidine triad (HIT) family protein